MSSVIAKKCLDQFKDRSGEITMMSWEDRNTMIEIIDLAIDEARAFKDETIKELQGMLDTAYSGLAKQDKRIAELEAALSHIYHLNPDEFDVWLRVKITVTDALKGE